jgi:hypothetical protein
MENISNQTVLDVTTYSRTLDASVQPVAEPQVPVAADAGNVADSFAQEYRSQVIAVELNLSRFGRSRQLTQRNRDEVADYLKANRRSVATSKRLYPANQSQIKRVNTLLGEARAVWMNMTIAYRKGMRLLRKERLGDFQRELEAIRTELVAALQDLDEHYDEIIAESRKMLGEEISDINDYPSTFAKHVSITWQVSNFEPSEDLLKLAPATYERERRRVANQFEFAIANYEQEAREQLSDLVDSLLTKLNPEDGATVRYTESATTNLRDFFDRFGNLGVVSDESLNGLVEDAKNALGETRMANLKKSKFKRDDMNLKFTAIKSRLDTLTEAVPARSIDFDDLDD